MTDRDPLLQEREKTHGSFKRNAEIWDRLCRATPEGDRLIPAQKLALCMIQMKVARALSNPKVKDHWDDIAGYAKLASEACD